MVDRRLNRADICPSSDLCHKKPCGDGSRQHDREGGQLVTQNGRQTDRQIKSELVVGVLRSVCQYGDFKETDEGKAAAMFAASK